MSALPHDSFDANCPKFLMMHPHMLIHSRVKCTCQMLNFYVKDVCHHNESMAHHHTIRLECVMYIKSYSLQIEPFKDSKSSWFWWSPIFQHSLFRNLREVVLELLDFWIRQRCVDFGALGAQRMLIVGYENDLCNQRPQRQMRLCYQVSSDMFICSWMFCTWFKSSQMYPETLIIDFEYHICHPIIAF